jgi:hypothetical protein
MRFDENNIGFFLAVGFVHSLTLPSAAAVCQLCIDQ